MYKHSMPTRLIYPMPFASGANAAYTPISNTATAVTPNFPEGFPSSFSSPHSAAGKYVTRGMINALGRLATQNDFYRMCGGINEFNPDFAILIGGYPKGAILDYYTSDTNNFTKVVSTEDNNMVDYRGKTPTDAQAAAGITAGGVVSGGPWIEINTDLTGAQNPVVTFASSYAGNSETPVGMFKADKNGHLEFYGDYTVNAVNTATAGGGTMNVGAWARVVMVSGGTTMESAAVSLATARSQNKASVVFDLGNAGITSAQIWPFTSGVNVCQGLVEEGNYYTLWMTCISLNLPTGVSACDLKAYIR